MFSRKIPKGKALVVQHGGSKKVYTEGTVKLMPFVDKVLTELELEEQTLAADKQPVVTKDGQTALISLVVRFYISQPEVYIQNAPERLEPALTSLLMTASRDLVSCRERDKALEELGRTLLAAAGAAVKQWGLTLSDAAVTEFENM